MIRSPVSQQYLFGLCVAHWFFLLTFTMENLKHIWKQRWQETCEHVCEAVFNPFFFILSNTLSPDVEADPR